MSSLSPLRLLLDGDALVANWRWLAGRNPSAACGAAIKADGYGLGARAVLERLSEAGCRDFFCATWAEAAALGDLPAGVRLSVLHGVRDEDRAAIGLPGVRPVLNSAMQAARWREAGGGACDVMVDTGMNRLGFDTTDALGGALDGLQIETLMSHLACADEPGQPMNARQQEAFAAVRAAIPAQRYSLANSAGILLGQDYAFDLTRPGLALYGGMPTAAAAGIMPVAALEAQVLQVRTVQQGETVGYGATWQASRRTRIAILNLGYADGYLRGLGPVACAWAADRRLPLVGRISMDLMAVDLTDAEVGEGDWLRLDFDLPRLAAAMGLSQYELLTGLGARYERRWN